MNVTRLTEADEAVSQALATLVERWMAEDGGDDPTVPSTVVADLFRTAVTGGIRPLVVLAADWGMVGESTEAIADGFRRTVAASIELHLKLLGDRPIGWAMEEGRDEGQ